MNRSDRGGMAWGGVLITAALATATLSAALVSATLLSAGRPAALAQPPAPSPAGSLASDLTVANGSWRMITAGHYGSASNASGYSAAIAPARQDAWVFGGTNPGEASSPLAAHWNGRAWKMVALPGGLGSFISAASASGPANVWAVSAFGGYALRWDGVRWSVARRWSPGAQATCVTAISPADVWLFGAPSHGTRGTGTWHFDGRKWTSITGPNTAVYRASAVSARDIWAISAGPRGGSVEHWNGRGWHQIRTGPALADTQLEDVLATSRDSVWVIGSSPAADEDGHVVVAHWDGRSWQRHQAIGRVIPRRVAADGRGGIWITAMSLGSQTQSRLLHLLKSGRWTQTVVAHGLGNAISDLALIPGTRSLWGSGGFLTASGGEAAIWLHGPPTLLRHRSAAAARRAMVEAVSRARLSWHKPTG
jgi:hypothetical protein